MVYRQTDYPQLLLGSSGLNAAQYGCYDFTWINLMNAAGYEITPEQYYAAMNAHGGHTADGLTVWAAVTACFPPCHYGGGTYQIVRATNGVHNHFWGITPGGETIDPWTGGASHPAGYTATSAVQHVTIDPASSFGLASSPVSVPVQPHFDPFLADLWPSQTYNPEVARMQRYLTAKGFFQDAGAQDGYYGPKTQNAVHAFQLAHGIVSDPGYYGLWLELTRGKANQDLSNPTNQSV